MHAQVPQRMHIVWSPPLPPCPPPRAPCPLPLTGARPPSFHPPCSISDNGQVLILVVRGTQLVQEACRRHETSPTAGAALGRALLGTLLMAAFREEGEKTQVWGWVGGVGGGDGGGLP